MFKNFILTNFNLSKWKEVNIQSIQKIINGFKDIELLGELGHPEYDVVVIEKSVIKISNIIMLNGVCYGDINPITEKADEILKNNGRVSIRANAFKKNGVMEFQNIITWDLIE